MNPYTMALDLAVLSQDSERINRETERLMQAIANDLSAVSQKYGNGSTYWGLVIATVDSFAASLRLIADEQDLAIAEEISKHVTACTIDARGGKT